MPRRFALKIVLWFIFEQFMTTEVIYYKNRQIEWYQSCLS